MNAHRNWCALIAGVSVVLVGCSGTESPRRDRALPNPSVSATAAPPVRSASPSPSSGPTSPNAAAPADAGPAGLGGAQVLARGLRAPWGLAFLPGGDALVTERDTRRILQITPAGGVSEVQVVDDADAGGEGGLLGIAVSPDYARNGLVYAYYTTATDNRISRFRLGERPQPIVTGIPVSGIHNGGRLAFGPDGMLYAGTGDASERGRSQDRSSLGGKVLRMTPEGGPAPGNPFPGSIVFTTGHRNVQGLGFDEQGRLYATEFGQDAFDEVNLLVSGADYGWPRVEGDVPAPGATRPLLTWKPAESSPSGAVVAAGSFWVAALRGERLWQVALDGAGGIGERTVWLQGEFGRLRHVALEPSGKALWILTSNRDGRGDPVADDDRIIRVPLVPA
jgi:glucose/arabinose dehydrogenase